jgi:2-dehydro-3-deoxygluconokinase
MESDSASVREQIVMSLNQSRRKHFVLVGEALGMFVLSEAFAASEISKIQVELTIAGAESNVATYLARLSHKTTYLSRVGADELGKLVMRYLHSQGVDISLVEVDESWQTGIAIKERCDTGTNVRYYRKWSAASRLDETLIPTLLDSRPDFVHMSGIIAALSSTANSFLHGAVNKLLGTCQISFDVNYRPALWDETPSEEMLEICNLTNICFIGLDEAKEIWGADSPELVRRLVHQPEFLIVKLGPEGSVVFHRDGIEQVDALQLQVVEPVGAGDAFAAGFLHGLASNMQPRDCARFGTILASASLLTSADVGDLPEKSYVDALMRLSTDEWRSTRFENTRRKPEL